MRLPGRVAAAIEILTEILERHRPASEALRDWGKAHRFAGSADRHAIGTLVYDGLRNKLSAAHAAGQDTPRAIVFGVLKTVWGMSVADIDALSGEEHGPGKLSAGEKKALAEGNTAAALDVSGDFPAWLESSYAKVFGKNLVAETQALAKRAPIDLRVNSLKATRAQVLEILARFGANEGPFSPLSIRIEAPGHDQKHINVEAEPAHGMGWFEVQDSASQIAALMSGVQPGETVLDLCAGAGGKTLALAAMMKNQGKLYAYDRDRHRLRPIFERLIRSGATNVEVVAADNETQLDRVGGFDCVVIDAPCSGSGSWRRKPDAKWRFGQKQLDMRLNEQASVLKRGAGLVKPGGRLIYITCSVLPEENVDQVKAFLAVNKNYKITPYTEQWRTVIGTEPPKSVDGSRDMLTLSPYSHGTDGFFVTVMQKH